ncbi:MAG TPA: hypothetical protein ENK75_04860 [Saprospiraceae bacterium]|nr:hypothetical protein [Saprospiraceae bacterium]
MSVDIFNLESRQDISSQKKILWRKYINLGMSAIVFSVILIFNSINKDSVINELFKVAGFTYGPLLGMFSFGLFSKIKVKSKLIPIVVIISPVLSYFINQISPAYGYHFGFEILLLNGLITYFGLWIIRHKE